MWTKEKLLESQCKTVSIHGDDVVIRKLKVCEVMNKDGSDEDRAFKMIKNSLIEPSLTMDEIKNLPIDFQSALQEEIISLNGLNSKEANQGN